MKNEVCIIVLNWNGKEDTSLCLKSIEEAHFDGEVVIVDNGSTDGSQEYFKTHFSKATLIETGENLGYAGGNNVGIEYGLKKGYPYFLILNNDTTVDPHIINNFLKTAAAHPEGGIFGGKIYLMEDRTRFDHFGGMWDKRRIHLNMTGFREVDDGKSWEAPFPLDYVTGAALFVRREVFETIGLMDPRYFLYWEETDFCFHARKAGFHILTAPQAILWHKVSASFTGGKPHSTYFFWRNRLLWVERNFSGLERFYYFLRLIPLNAGALLGLTCLRSFQLGLQKLLRRSTTRNHDRLLRYRAALTGVKDYLTRNFGEGSNQLFLKK